MKKILFAAAAFAALASCSQEPDNTFVINGTISGYDKPVEKVFLYENKTVVDSANVVDSKFTFKGVPDSARMYTCQVNKPRISTPVFVDLGSVANVAITKEGVAVEDNGGVNSLYTKHLKDYGALKDSLYNNYMNLRKDNAPEEELDKAAEAYTMGLKKSNEDFVAANKDNMAGAFVMTFMCRNFETLEEFDSNVNVLRYKNSFPAFKTARTSLENLINTSAGKMFVDFKGKDLDGKEISLSDFAGKGKYVLVDFWASWCGPCRGEIPNLVKIHKKYAGKKFTVLGVNVWDEKDEFMKALKEEGVKYPQIFASESKEATALYGINGIPQILLIAPDGKIVERDLRGDHMAEVVKKVLGK